MKISEGSQEILESLWIELIENGKENVPRNGFNEEEINELLRTGCISISNNQIKLKPKGKEEARKVIRRHRLAERLLHDVLNVGEDDMESSACKFEHIISEGVEESICILLGHPTVCPHGKPIPRGICCSEGKETTQKVISSLSRLRKGDEGSIVYIKTKNTKNLQKLLAMGVLPGLNISVIQTYPSYVFQIGHTQIAVDQQIADDIIIRIIPKSQKHLGRERKRSRFGRKKHGKA